jgi:two-component system NtrC family sensor kinase
MSLIAKIKPKFWDYHDAAAGHHLPGFSFRRKWKLIVTLTSVVALTPLIVMTIIDFRLSRGAIEAEMLTNTSRMVSNTWRTVSFFLTQRKSALDFVMHDNSYQSMREPGRLAAIFKNLQSGVGGFTDIGLVNAAGNMEAYAGPYHLQGTNLCNEKCYRQVLKKGTYISDVTGDKGVGRRIVIAIKHDLPDNTFFVLRAALDAGLLYRLLSQLDIDPNDDAFIINENGILQTPSRHHGGLYDKIDLPVPEPASEAKVIEAEDASSNPILIGYAYIPGTSFILMIIRDKSEVTALWLRPRLKLIGFLVLSIAIILFAILGGATYLVNRIHVADQKRVVALHQVEYTNKLASLGRLSSGVAHEINNPLAIINQKVGLIKDLFIFKEEYAGDEKLMGLIDEVLASVQRCSSITRRLLDFSRHMESRIEPIDLKEMIHEVLAFLEKEAERRRVDIIVDHIDNIPEFESDRGSLQQILLNLFNNAFAAMEDGGRLEIAVNRQDEDVVCVTVADNGCGIPAEDITRVFEPFFSTRGDQGGPGLGLSITYGLVKEIGGDIQVDSTVGKGTRFSVLLPMQTENRDDVDLAGTYAEN